MQSRDFCFWLQGFFELSGDVPALSAEQAAMIRRHLDMVFHHEIEARDRTRPPPVPVPKAPPEPVRAPVREAPQPSPHPPPMC